VGAAPTPREVIEFIHAIGVPLAELWGMSETTAYGAATRPTRSRSAPWARPRLAWR
jgi:long-chain acyl-CoA synthetase